MERSYFNNNGVDVTHILIRAREKEICKIEKEVKEVNELFVTIGNLAEESSPMLDSIEYNIERSGYNSAAGVEELAEAEKSQKFFLPPCCASSICLKFIFLLFFCFLLFLLFLLLVLIFH